MSALAERLYKAVSNRVSPGWYHEGLYKAVSHRVSPGWYDEGLYNQGGKSKNIFFWSKNISILLF